MCDIVVIMRPHPFLLGVATSLWVMVSWTVPFFVWDAQAASIGDQHTFNVSPLYDISGRDKVTGTLRLVGQWAQYFIEDSYWNSKIFSDQQDIFQKLNRLSGEFDGRIYPLETGFWGAEPNPGIDNDPKVVILLTNLIATAGGYYDTSNQYSREQVPESNTKEIIFLNIRSLDGDRRIYSFLAHEFQHLISFNQKTILRNADDDIWLNEVRSEYAPTQLGYNDVYEGSNLKRRVAAFLADPTDSLTEWGNEAKDYGQVALFGEYVAEHYGASILTDALKSNQGGIESITEALVQNNRSLNFSDLFMNWAVANAVNDIVPDSTYGYFREGLRQELLLPPTQTITSVDDQTDLTWTHEFKDWQAKWFWVTGFPFGSKNVLQVNFSGPKRNWFKVALVNFKANGQKEVRFSDLSTSAETSAVYVDLAGTEKIILIPIKMEKSSEFTNKENLTSLTMNFKRIAVAPISTPSPQPSQTPTPSPTPSPSTMTTSEPATPEKFGLKEGDFIRAEGDNDVYIINQFGYKRLILNPKICLQYGHLGKRGCFSAVKIVSAAVRDAFVTSWFVTNGETKDGKVYWLKPTGEDTADLYHLQITGDDFLSQGGNFKSVFVINSLEQNSHHLAPELKNLPR